MRSLCCKWQKTNPEPSCQTRNLLAQEAKRPRAYVASEWHLYPFLPLGLILLWTVRSFSDVHLPHSYKTAASSAYGCIHPVCVCDTHLCSTFPAMLLLALILPPAILEPGGKYRWFSASGVRICCPELWPPSCDHDRWGRHKNLKNGQELEFWMVSFGCRINQPWIWPGYMK